jgi:threonylcarbamoyladenosine tRNA methylthiotransferase MtaB
LVLGATEKITDYINDLSKNDFGEVHSCEIADADFYVKLLDRRQNRAFLKVGWLRYKCLYTIYRGLKLISYFGNVVDNSWEGNLEQKHILFRSSRTR